MTDQNPSDLFKVRLKAARELRKMNQTQLAEKAGFPPSSIAHFEGGGRKPSFDNLRNLAAALEVTTDYLLGRTDDPTQSKDADPLYREVSKLSEHDRKMTHEFMKMLAQMAKDKEGGKKT